MPIDFTLSERDKGLLENIRASALIARKYARYYDEHEETELAPEQLPEAAEFKKPFDEKAHPYNPKADSGMAVMGMLQTMAQMWGDYAVRLKRQKGGLGNAALQAAGTPDQQKKWGGLTLAMAITEPGCGSDPSRVQTSATLDPKTNEWVLNGEKIFVTTGVRAEGVVAWATVNKAAGRAGIKSFLVLKGTPGFTVAKKEKKLGIRGDDTAAYVFDNCRIPRENLLGGKEEVEKEGSGGFKGVMKTFNMTRPGVGAIGLGVAEAALDFTREQLEEAHVDISYGGSLASQTAIAKKFQDLETLWEASRLTVLRAAWLAEKGKPNNMEASVAKAHAGAAVRRICQGCIEILGTMGVSREHLLEKWLRDCRITDIYEGTGQIQRLIIARTLLDYTREDLK